MSINCSAQTTRAFVAPPSRCWKGAIPTSSELFVEITRFIWDANPSYDVYQEFTKRHFQASYKVHELISARINAEKQNEQSAVADDTPPYEGGFFKRLFRRRSNRSQSKSNSVLPSGSPRPA
jgi:hypothetical protein